MIVENCMKRQVIFIQDSATVQDAAQMFAIHHIGTLPVINPAGQLVGILDLRDLLQLTTPTFVSLIEDFDFVGDFGAVEEFQPTQALLQKPVNQIMERACSVEAQSGLLRAFSFILKHDLYDLPVVDNNNRLVGLASKVDIGNALLAKWPTVNLAEKKS